MLKQLFYWLTPFLSYFTTLVHFLSTAYHSHKFVKSESCDSCEGGLHKARNPETPRLTPNDSEIQWLWLGNWVNQVLGQFAQYNDPDSHTFKPKITKLQNHLAFVVAFPDSRFKENPSKGAWPTNRWTHAKKITTVDSFLVTESASSQYETNPVWPFERERWA